MPGRRVEGSRGGRRRVVVEWGGGEGRGKREDQRQRPTGSSCLSLDEARIAACRDMHSRMRAWLESNATTKRKRNLSCKAGPARSTGAHSDNRKTEMQREEKKFNHEHGTGPARGSRHTAPAHIRQRSVLSEHPSIVETTAAQRGSEHLSQVRTKVRQDPPPRSSPLLYDP